MNKVSRIAKIVAATAAGAVMLGATVSGAAFAGDFTSFPAPFVKNGQFDGKIVVGANAATSDVVGAIGIAAALGQAVASYVPTASMPMVFEELKGDVSFGSYVASAPGFVTPIRSSKLSILNDYSGDNELKYKDSSDSIKAHQELYLLSVKADKGIESSDKGVYKVYAPSDSIEFKMVFDEPYDQSKGELAFSVFGKDVSLKGYSGTGALVLSTGSKFSVSLDAPTVSDPVTGATLVFKGASVDGSKIYVTVTNAGLSDTAVLDSGVEKTVAGVTIKAVDVFRASDSVQFASVYIGSKLSKTVSVNDKFLGDESWTLKEVDSDSSGLHSFTVQYSPENAASLGAGESLTGLFSGFSIYNKGYTVKDSSYFKGVKVRQSDSQRVYDSCGSSPTTATKEALLVSWPAAYIAQVGGVDVKDAYLYSPDASTTIVSYHPLSGDDYKCLAVSTVSEATLVELNYAGTTDVKVTYKAGDKLKIYVDGVGSVFIGDAPFEVVVSDVPGTGFSKIGQGKGTTAQPSDIVYDSKLVGDKDYEFWSVYGAKLHSPKASLDNGEVILDVPSEQNKITVSVSKPVVTATPVTVTTVPYVPVATLDSEVTDLNQNFILVGGPSVNSLVKQLGGRYADLNTYSGEAKLFWIDNVFGGAKSAVVVAGWDAVDTTRAAEVLARYKQTPLSGTEKAV
jgi:hypothetical protein